MDTADLESVRERLLAQAFLFDDPAAYAAGVEDTLSRLQQLEEPVARTA